MANKGDYGFIPFGWQGQYFDEETELAYNRFRYYSPDTGTYISQDPIGLAGGMPNMYAYVYDSNSQFYPFGQKIWSYSNMPKIDGFQNHHIIPRSLSDHSAFKSAGMNIDASRNMIYLPTERANHPTRSIHKGWNKQHKAYNANMKQALDDIDAFGKANNWKQADYEKAIKGLQNDTRKGLRKGKISCH